MKNCHRFMILRQRRRKISKKRGSRETGAVSDAKLICIKNTALPIFSMRTLANNQRQPFKKNIDSATATKIGYRLWSSWNRFLYGDGRAVHFLPVWKL